MFRHLLQHFQKTPPRELCETWALLNQEHLVSYARACVGDFVDIELVVSKAMLSVMEAFYAGKVPPEKLMAYAHKAIRNIAVNTYVKESHRGEAEDAYIKAAEIRAGGTLHYKAATPEEIDLRIALQQMPPEVADVLTRYVWERYSFADIAEALNLSETTVRRRYQQGLSFIKTHLSK